MMKNGEMIEVIQAHKDGKRVQYRLQNQETGEWQDTDNPMFNFSEFDYRIKPESQYRPYKDINEFKNAMCLKYNNRLFEWVLENRNIFLLNKNSGDCVRCMIAGYKSTGFILCGDRWYNLNEMFETFSYSDGTPFGAKDSKEW